MLAGPSAAAWMPSATYWASSWNCRPWLTFAALNHQHRDQPVLEPGKQERQALTEMAEDDLDAG
jgi:hypothetical protein